MIDIKKIVQNKDQIEENLKKRDPSIDLSHLVILYDTKTKLKKEYDFLRIELKNKNQANNTDELRIKSQHSKDIDKKIKEIELEIQNKLLVLPNILSPNTPISKNKHDCIIVDEYGSKPAFDFKPKTHYDIAKQLDIIDMERGAKLAGSGFPIYKGKGAILEWALLSYMIHHSVKNNFVFILPPFLNNTTSLISSGNLPKFKDEIYSFKDDDLHAIPTSEVPLTNIYRDETLNEKELPLHLVAYSPCFRKEAGGYGQKSKGLMRLHQFNKVETYSICTPEHSSEELEHLVRNASEIMKNLNLHFRVANLPSCDIAQQSSQTLDIEAWLPAQEIYSEVSSASNCLDYQARRANIRYKTKEKTKFVHTLNCSGLATPRLFIALIESNQNKDGTVNIPEVLVPYTHFEKID